MTAYDSIEGLELNSQTQLLSRIQFLTRFSSNLVQVTGEAGSGKTWLSERYLGQLATDPKQALLLCNTNHKETQHRAIILRQLVRDGIFNEEDTLVDSLSSMLKDESIHALIVIDDAHLLSQEIATELWQLISFAQNRTGWQINILLFARQSKLFKWVSKAAKPQREKPLEIEIAELNDSEREIVTSAIITTFSLNEAERRAFKMRAQDAPSYPGTIIDCAYPTLTNQPLKKSRSFFIPISVTILVLLLGMTLFFWLQVPKGTTVKELIAMLFNNQVETPSPVVKKTNIDSLAQEDRFALPAQPDIDDLTVGGEDDTTQRTVVVSSEVVDAMMSDQQKTDDAATEELVGLSEIIVGNNETGTAANTGTFAKIPLSNNMLMAVPSSRYALQLGAFESLTDLNSFIHKYDLQGRVLVYETRREGVPWYMVLLGDYPTVDEARRTEQQLSKTLRSLGPWAKSFTQIHKEIARVQ